MRYTLELDEKTVQLLVDTLRRLPHMHVDAEIQSIRRQCLDQDRRHAEVERQRMLDQARRLLAEEPSAPAFPGPDA